MAKDQKDKKARQDDPVATALTTPDAPVATSTTPAVVPAGGPPERLGDGVRDRSAPAAPAPATQGPGRGVADGIVSVVADVARTVRGVLPNRAPVYLGGAALIVLGVVDLPVAAGGALAYEAIRRWDSSSSTSSRS